MLTPFDLSSPAAAAGTALSAAADRVRLVRENLIIVAAQATGAAADADWRSPAASRFHERIEFLRANLLAAELRAHDLADAALKTRARLFVCSPMGSMP